MNDPYSVLGVQQTASDAEIKKAYRELVRKYHPDNYHNNPLADLAQEKMKEINEAYDIITKNREGGSRSGTYNPGGYTRSQGGSAEFNKVRAAINAGNLGLAEELLNGAPTRNAEWHFLMGSLYYRKGWLDDARRYFQTAVTMEPGNQEYVQALNFMEQGGQQAYNPYGYNYNQGAGGCTGCDICAGMLCADMCCHCFQPMRGTARKITISAVLTALTVVFLFIGNVFPAGREAMIAIASLFVTAAVIEAGLGAAASVFVGSAVLGALVLPEKTTALLFALFFGYYPIVKSLAERISKAVLTWAVKIAAFNVSLTVVWFIFKALLLGPNFADISVLVVYAVGNVVFILYDIGLTKLISLYIVRISKNLRKDQRRGQRLEQIIRESFHAGRSSLKARGRLYGQKHDGLRKRQRRLRRHRHNGGGQERQQPLSRLHD